MLNQYLRQLFKISSSGEATEESYYSTLERLLESFLEAEKIKKGTITALPKKKEGNKPDFVIRKGRELVGYIEAKDFAKVSNLEFIENSEQIERYKKDFENFILTNFVDFWLWRKSEKSWVKKVKIAQSKLIGDFKISPPLENGEKLLGLLADFVNFSTPEAKGAKQLAIELASRAKRMREPLLEELMNKIETDVDKIFRAFRKYLMPDLTEDNFADIYAQTITYGLFIARLQFKGEGKDFNRTVARDLIPKNLKILRDTFYFVSRRDLTKNIDYIIDDIATVLAHCNIEKIKGDLHREKGKDPIVHFYETFLIEYDKEKRKRLGEYYTPLPVVSYIIRSINILLKEKFRKNLGFASDDVTLLDFASGTCTFPAQAIAQAKKEIEKSSVSGDWIRTVKNHILKNFYAFEISMASWIIGQLKIALLLEDLGYKMTNEDKFNLYLTNTLDFTKIEGQGGMFEKDLSEEAEKAGKVKREKPVLVIMGNPPYSVSSSNVIKAGTEFSNFYEEYKKNVRKEEKNIQPLSDDYIKFIAFAHWKIKQSGNGIVGVITNNSYLDGLIHRDMRKKLAEDFNEIYILNLHGSAKRGEKTPKGGKDENVFNIQQGVGIILLVKNNKLKNKIKYCDLLGLRNEKFKFLENFDIRKTKWQDLIPREPNYFLVPKDLRGEKKYQNFISIENIFEKYNAGIVTGKDEILTNINKYELKNVVSNIYHNPDDKLLENLYDLKNSAGMKILKKRKGSEFQEEKIACYHYRPLDRRFVYYEEIFLERNRSDIARNLLKSNLCFSVARIGTKDKFSNIIVSNCLADYKLAESTRGSYIFPLYLYKARDEQSAIFSGQEKLDLKGVQHSLRKDGSKEPNIKSEIFEMLEKSFGKKVLPEEIFYYIYAILYSNKYRQKYNEFLKIDFPRIPFTADYSSFKKLAKIGEKLANLHLLKDKSLAKTSAKYKGAGLNEVKKREYREKEKRLYINDNQYFEGIPKEIWNYHIGGYQVLDKWMKDRVGKSLERNDQEHYLKMIEVLRKTIKIQKEIDKYFPNLEKKIASRN